MKLHIQKHGLFVPAMLVMASVVLGQEPKAPQLPPAQFWVDATLISYQPGQELATYSKCSGDVGGAPNSTLGLAVADAARRFEVRIACELKSQKFLVTVHITPDKQDPQTKAQDLNLDLTDLSPRSIEIARNADGRVYKLTLTPRIKLPPQITQFKASAMQMDLMSLSTSPVILNDEQYLGTFGASGGSLAWCDIPGVAKIEFSLLHLKDALPLGMLNKGMLSISHDSTTLSISDVKNGAYEQTLAGGPYTVWVRWSKPSQTVEEYHQALKQQISIINERVKNGDLTLPPGTLERLEKMAASSQIGMISNGVRGVRTEELAERAE